MTPPPPGRWPRIGAVIFCLLPVVALALRIAKAHLTGVVHDEALTWLYFSHSAQEALGLYPIPNNHLLHSLAVSWCQGLAPYWDHWIRVPALVGGTIYGVGAAWVVARVARPWLLRIGLLALLLFHGWLFDLTLLARGYSLALAAVMVELGLVLALASRPEGRWLRRLVPAAIVLLNVLALGAMPTSLFVVVALTAVAVGLLLRTVPDQPKRTGLHALAWVVLLGGGTALGCWAVYHQVLGQMLTITGVPAEHLPDGWEYLLELARGPLTGEAALSMAQVILAGFVGLWLIGLKPVWRQPWGPQQLPVVVFVLTLVLMLLYATLLGRPLGHLRNGIFLLPLAVLATGPGLQSLWRERPGRIVGALGLVGVLLVTAPHPTVVQQGEWDVESVSGPLVRELKTRAPEREWTLRLSYPLRFLSPAFTYYQHQGYRIRVVRGKTAALYLWRIEEAPDDADPAPFAEFGVAVEGLPKRGVSLRP